MEATNQMTDLKNNTARKQIEENSYPWNWWVQVVDLWQVKQILEQNIPPQISVEAVKEQQSDVVETIMTSIFWEYKDSSGWFSMIPNRVRKVLEKHLLSK